LQEQLDTMYTTTWQLRRDEVADVVFTATPLFNLLDQNGRRDSQKGGRRIEQPLRYGKNSSVQFLGKGDTVDYVDDDNLTVAYYEWKYLTGHIYRDFRKFQKNRGEARFKDKVSQDINSLQDSLVDTLEVSMFGSGGGDIINGLQLLVADDPTTSDSVGGINQADYEWWRNNSHDMAGEEASTYLVTNMRREFNDCGTYGSQNAQRFPDIMVTTQDVYEKYEEECLALGQITKTNNQDLADLGFGDLSFKGQPITWSPSCPDEHMYLLNTQYLRWVTDPIEYMELGEWQQIEGRPRDRVAHNMTVGNLTVANRRKHSVIFSIFS